MTAKTCTYDTDAAKQLSLKKLLGILTSLDVKKVYVKKLAKNDNSKNQPYFGSHLTDLSFIPTGDIEASQSDSQKSMPTKRSIKYQASVNLFWVDAVGKTYKAPDAKLIYYPQYPEVRFSGFLKASKVNASRWMDPSKEGRAVGRWLVLGVSSDKKVYSYLVTPESALSKELEGSRLSEITAVFSEIDFEREGVIDTREALLNKLLEIHNMEWIYGQKLGRDGVAVPYKARNGGGYTLESLLGVQPNGIAEPDYLGWEVKQFGVKRFPAVSAKPTTLMTPEPDGGVYKDLGAKEFVCRFGYPDKSGKLDRWNFGGRHIVSKKCNTTNLMLHLKGFDPDTMSLLDANGAITLIDENDVVAASWSFPKIMNHWKRKHSQAVYVPCMSRIAASGEVEYLYGQNIELGVGTDFEMLLSSMCKGHVYYDPGIKLENVSTPKSKIKKRSQFRVNHKHLDSLYKSLDFVDVTN